MRELKAGFIRVERGIIRVRLEWGMNYSMNKSGMRELFTFEVCGSGSAKFGQGSLVDSGWPSSDSRLLGCV